MNVILYTSGCPRCNMLKKELDKNGIMYDVFDDVDKMIEMGFNEVPILKVDNTKMNYTEAIKWIKKGSKI